MMYDTSPALDAAESMVARWQNELGPDIEVVLSGSLCSGLFIWDKSTSAIDVEVKFLVDQSSVFASEVHDRIESVTGLRLRKQIDVGNDPDESKSVGLLFEGRFVVAGVSIPLQVEGCLRNRRYRNWARFYPVIFGPGEINEMRRVKAQIKASGNRLAYERYKASVRRVADSRISGLIRFHAEFYRAEGGAK